jgi:hypothetical protein
MTNKFEKNTNCAYCNKPLDAKYRTKRFCDDKCRIYFNRETFVTKEEERVAGAIAKHIQESKKETTTTKGIVALTTPPMPKKEDFEDISDFWAARTEWKKKYNQ